MNYSEHLRHYFYSINKWKIIMLTAFSYRLRWWNMLPLLPERVHPKCGLDLVRVIDQLKRASDSRGPYTVWSHTLEGVWGFVIVLWGTQLLVTPSLGWSFSESREDWRGSVSHAPAAGVGKLPPEPSGDFAWWPRGLHSNPWLIPKQILNMKWNYESHCRETNRSWKKWGFS